MRGIWLLRFSNACSCLEIVLNLLTLMSFCLFQIYVFSFCSLLSCVFKIFFRCLVSFCLSVWFVCLWYLFLLYLSINLPSICLFFSVCLWGFSSSVCGCLLFVYGFFLFIFVSFLFPCGSFCLLWVLSVYLWYLSICLR